jgi:branched-chain amino acid aminotransferase
LEELKDFAECGLCGTAAVISPVGTITNQSGEPVFESSSDEMGPITRQLYNTLLDIQQGRVEAPEGWIVKIDA